MYSENNVADSYAKNMLHIEYLQETNISLRKEIFELQICLAVSLQESRELLELKNELLRENLNLQYERENTNKMQDEQIKKGLEKMDRLFELEIIIFEIYYLEQSKMLLDIDQLPEDMKKLSEHTKTELLLLKKELETEQRSLQHEENKEKVGDSDFNKMIDDTQRQVLDHLVKQIDDLME